MYLVTLSLLHASFAYMKNNVRLDCTLSRWS
jgi:hypothetical protein